MSALLFTIFGATLLTYLLSNWTLKKISSETLALYIFIQPVVATLLAYFFLDGELKWHMGVSLVFIAAGVGAVSLKEAHERNSNR
jgi:drug/metabolite transporter (DMT)-like permease